MADEQLMKFMKDTIDSLATRIDNRLDRIEDKLEDRTEKNGEQDAVLAGLCVRVENLSGLSKRASAGISTGITAAIVAIVELVKKLS